MCTAASWRFPICPGFEMMALAPISIVIPRESGVSSIPRRRSSSPASAITGSSDGACHRAALCADPVADDDNRARA
jgi:hypothetical protein